VARRLFFSPPERKTVSGAERYSTSALVRSTPPSPGRNAVSHGRRLISLRFEDSALMPWSLDGGVSFDMEGAPLKRGKISFFNRVEANDLRIPFL